MAYDTTSSVSSLSVTSQGSFILSPRINVTPEVSSVDNGSHELWVAIEITGVLRRADGRQHFENSPYHPTDYGRLHSIDIELAPGMGCQLTGTIGNLNQVPTLNAHETHLVLARIVLGKVVYSRHVKEACSAELIAELETDLGDSFTSFLTVRVTYRHSGLPDLPTMNTNGLSAHTTKVQTEAIAIIRRHNSQSAWSPRTSQTLAGPVGTNPLVTLIETHYSPARARETIKRLADERMPIPMAKRFQYLPGSSEETVTPNKIGIAASIDSNFHNSAEIDPARKIWVNMRRDSGYGRRRPRTSVSADHFFDNCHQGKGNISSECDQIRSDIMGMALRNKRSIGEETVDSLAAGGVVRASSTLGRAKGGGFGAMGVGLSQQWPPWWKSWLP